MCLISRGACMVIGWMNKYTVFITPFHIHPCRLEWMSTEYLSLPFIYIPGQEWMSTEYFSPPFISIPGPDQEWMNTQYLLSPLSYPPLFRNEWIQSIYHPFHIHPWSGMNEYRVFITPPFIFIPAACPACYIAHIWAESCKYELLRLLCIEYVQ